MHPQRGFTLLAAAVMVAMWYAPASAQAPAFEVASIRPNRSGGTSGIRPLPTGQFTATNVTLRELIRRAWGLDESQLIGGPGWITSEAFDIVARAAAPPSGGTQDVLLMLRTLLTDRFKLQVRTETRELPTYVLVMARADRRLGPRIRPSTIDCSTNPAPLAPNTAPLSADGWPPCGLGLTRTLVGASRSRTSVKQSAVSMPEFATRLQGAAGRPVLDRTGLTGVFDIEYEYVREGASIPVTPQPQATDVPDLFTALQEQLGLRLESQRNPVEVLVIDSVERPAEN